MHRLIELSEALTERTAYTWPLCIHGLEVCNKAAPFKSVLLPSSEKYVCSPCLESASDTWIPSPWLNKSSIHLDKSEQCRNMKTFQLITQHSLQYLLRTCLSFVLYCCDKASCSSQLWTSVQIPKTIGNDSHSNHHRTSIWLAEFEFCLNLRSPFSSWMQIPYSKYAVLITSDAHLIRPLYWKEIHKQEFRMWLVFCWRSTGQCVINRVEARLMVLCRVEHGLGIRSQTWATVSRSLSSL